MNFSNKKILLTIMVCCIFVLSCNKTLVKTWTKFSKHSSNIELDKKGINGIGGNFLIEKMFNSNSNDEKSEYFLKKSNGQIHKLGFELDTKEYQILYFEFTKKKLFLIINSLSSSDWISFKNFNLKTGELILADVGVLPCKKDTKSKNYGWSLGNCECTWINFSSHQVAYLRTSIVKESNSIDSLNTPYHEFNIFSYNWSDNIIDTLPRNFSIGIDAITGNLLISRNVKYNYEINQFEY